MKQKIKSVVKKDHAPKESGRSMYVGDYPDHGVLTGKLLRSKLAKSLNLRNTPELTFVGDAEAAF